MPRHVRPESTGACWRAHAAWYRQSTHTSRRPPTLACTRAPPSHAHTHRATGRSRAAEPRCQGASPLRQGHGTQRRLARRGPRAGPAAAPRAVRRQPRCGAASRRARPHYRPEAESAGNVAGCGGGGGAGRGRWGLVATASAEALAGPSRILHAVCSPRPLPPLPALRTHTHTQHTHTHTLSSPRSRKGCLRKRGTRSRRCVHNNTQRHNNTDAESHSPNLIHRISFTELKFECRTRVAEGTSAGRSTLRQNRTHFLLLTTLSPHLHLRGGQGGMRK